MPRTRYPKDRGLSVRMAATIALLTALLAGFLAALVVAGISLLVVVVIGAGFVVVQYLFSDRLALAALRARVVDRREAPELHAVVDRLCALAGMDVPRVALSPLALPNAFATGRNDRVAVVCVTDGLLRRLDERELEAVLAHELSHIAHHDAIVMTIAGFLGIVAGLVVRFGLLGGVMRGRRDNLAAMMALVVVVSMVVYAVSFLLTRALSRYRELSADRSAALLVGDPSALASALTRLSEGASGIPTKDLRLAEPVNALLLLPAVARRHGPAALLSTHPTLERRLERLAALDAELRRRPA